MWHGIVTRVTLSPHRRARPAVLDWAPGAPCSTRLTSGRVQGPTDPRQGGHPALHQWDPVAQLEQRGSRGKMEDTDLMQKQQHTPPPSPALVQSLVLHFWEITTDSHSCGREAGVHVGIMKKKLKNHHGYRPPTGYIQVEWHLKEYKNTVKTVKAKTPFQRWG